jgi:hypothetical protein
MRGKFGDVPKDCHLTITDTIWLPENLADAELGRRIEEHLTYPV